MSLSPTHSRASKKNRKMIDNGKPIQNVMTQELQYSKSDELVEKVYVDIANGASRSDCIEKITKGLYDGMERPLAARTAANYYNAALDRFAVDCDIEAEKLRKMFYGRYESLLADAIEKGDIYNARNILDSMSRIFGVERKTPETAIQINNNKDGITIHFGFTKDEDKDEEQEYEEINE